MGVQLLLLITVLTTIETAICTPATETNHSPERKRFIQESEEESCATLTENGCNCVLNSDEIVRRRYLGEEWKYSAYSCKEIAWKKPNATSGHYWIQGSRGSPLLAFCNLERRFKNNVRGWQRVAKLDMSNPSDQCPSNYRLVTNGAVRACGKGISGKGCSSVHYNTHGVAYKQVCGRVVAYQYATTDAFRQWDCPSPCTINDPYVDGVSVTHGYPRRHIWTFVASNWETGNRCPCYRGSPYRPPAFVGSDYYCESGSHYGQTTKLYTSDPLWDGQRCGGPESACCTNPNLPWFCTELPEPTTDNIEVRICSDEGTASEDTPVQLIELYIH